MSKNDYWDLTKRPHTKLKLEIYQQYLEAWCKIFKKQWWAKEIYIVDCCAGKGKYKDNGIKKDGSPLIAVKLAKKYMDEFKNEGVENKNSFNIKCYFIEKNYADDLKKTLSSYKNLVEYKIINGDFNNEIVKIVNEIGSKPTLFFIDPCGIKQVKKESIACIVKKVGAKDILLNYINEGVVRVSGVAKKCFNKKVEDISIQEIKTITQLTDFIGKKCLDILDKGDVEILKFYVENVIKFNNKNVDRNNKLDVIAFDMPYPHKRDTIYYLLFASRNKTARRIISQVYAKSKRSDFKGQQTLFSNIKDLLKIHKDFKV